ncbi:MAG TPA: beta-xylosidase, partial [Vicinamibacteria bacterium]|nr:beta-xylosidase [Vicinamibacteria bacterium]
PEPRRATVERIDETHANPRRLWRELGEPGYLDAKRIARLQKASELSSEPLRWQRRGDETAFELALPPHSVAVITLELSGR